MITSKVICVLNSIFVTHFSCVVNSITLNNVIRNCFYNALLKETKREG